MIKMTKTNGNLVEDRMGTVVPLVEATAAARASTDSIEVLLSRLWAETYGLCLQTRLFYWNSTGPLTEALCPLLGRCSMAWCTCSSASLSRSLIRRACASQEPLSSSISCALVGRGPRPG